MLVFKRYLIFLTFFAGSAAALEVNITPTSAGWKSATETGWSRLSATRTHRP